MTISQSPKPSSEDSSESSTAQNLGSHTTANPSNSSDNLSNPAKTNTANHPASGKPIMELSGIIREFPAGEQTIRVLHDINLTIHQGEMVAIIGQSGSGKSTLMNILGCLDQATAGDYKIYGQSARKLDADQLAELRREHFGFIFQRYHLLGDISAKDNVAVPAVYAGMDTEARTNRAEKLLTDLGLGNKVNNRPNQVDSSSVFLSLVH